MSAIGTKARQSQFKIFMKLQLGRYELECAGTLFVTTFFMGTFNNLLQDRVGSVFDVIWQFIAGNSNLVTLGLRRIPSISMKLR